jgi:hypothetical protein
VDFEKAYDSVKWGFLQYMLRRFGFCEVWIAWMKECIFGGNLSVLVNGCPKGEIDIHRGLKQGDPLAPFLFLLVAEGLGGAMKRAVDINLFKGFKICNTGPGGVNGGKKICWVKWRVVCRDKKSGGLGVRDIKVANYSLLMKWRWRLLQIEERGLWKDVLVAKYGDHVIHNAGWSIAPAPYFASLWWKDICNLEGCVVSKN